MKYKVKIKKSEEKYLHNIPRNIKQKIKEKVNGLTDFPEISDIKKLKSEKSSFRTRIGDYRIIFSINYSEKLITVYLIRHRKDVYKTLN